MKLHTMTSAAAVLIAAATAVAVPEAAGAAQDTRTSFVVNTQFWDDPSPIVAASGPLAACTTAQEEPGGLDTQTGPNTVMFTGTKTLDCEGGTVTISYEATFNSASGRKTLGTWSVVDSTLSGVSSGGGRLTGDAERCELLSGSDGCILDTFAGNVGS